MTMNDETDVKHFLPHLIHLVKSSASPMIRSPKSYMARWRPMARCRRRQGYNGREAVPTSSGLPIQRRHRVQDRGGEGVVAEHGTIERGHGAMQTASDSDGSVILLRWIWYSGVQGDRICDGSGFVEPTWIYELLVHQSSSCIGNEGQTNGQV